MKVLCVHHKGGVGKTTTAIHITGVFLSKRNRVLLIDGDPRLIASSFSAKEQCRNPVVSVWQRKKVCLQS
ncbi:MAG: ParA family protein [Hormoscilla sp. GM7CHS1pb]|nr:ParA family protein [Hormoscilla sp. GM7CHS1pb]